MKFKINKSKIRLLSVIIFSLLIFLVPQVSIALEDEDSGFVPCGNVVNPDGTIANPCTIGHFFLMAHKIYLFALQIVFVIAGLMILIGGVLLMVSGGIPSLYQTARNMIFYSIIGIVIMLASWLIINTVFLALGYSPNWTLPGF